jgi:ABC-type bacteriocin/lantibiotic exporter with double-glycine peptidase domain
MEELTQLAQYGLVGICISLIVLTGLVLDRLFKFMGNHTNHNTEAWIKNTEALTELTSKIKEDIKSQKETAETIRCLQETLYRKG